MLQFGTNGSAVSVMLISIIFPQKIVRLADAIDPTAGVLHASGAPGRFPRVAAPG